MLKFEKTVNSDIFLGSLSISGLKITVFDDIYAYIILQSAVVFPA